MSLRIGFDLDGVLADMEGELVRQAEILFGEPITRCLEERAVPDRADVDASSVAAEAAPDPAGSAEGAPNNVPPLLKINMTPRQQRRLWRHVESIENFWESLAELEPGIIERLARITSDRRWEIIFLTKRPETVGVTSQVQTQRWLESHGFRMPSVYVVQGSRGRIAAALALDIVVDDRPENCLDVVVDSKARAILIWREGENQLPAAAQRLGIGVVKTVGECLDILTQIDTAASREEPGVLNRVMRLLGLKEPASA
jgi:deoxypyrimidine-specific 5' nucleotidase type C protein (NT5C)